MTPFTIYLLSRCNTIKCMSFAVFFLSIIFLMIVLFITFVDLLCELKEDYKLLKKTVKLIVIAIIVSGTLTIIFPSNNEMVAMYIVPAIMNSKIRSKDIPDFVVNFLKSYAEDRKKSE